MTKDEARRRAVADFQRRYQRRKMVEMSGAMLGLIVIAYLMFLRGH
jgi:hypothetical protein